MSVLTSMEKESKFDFSSLKKLLQLTDGNLGAHLLKLEAAEYIETEKMFQNRKPKTFVIVTSKGRFAFEEHVKALEEIIRGTKEKER